ncbi:MAG: hydrolase 76 protein [Peltula sp. TS41687]|nr:MAG: hydrolase 76 protein [Peltula sp. TS41687]
MRLFSSSSSSEGNRAGWRVHLCLTGALLLGGQLCEAIELNLESTDSIKAAAKTVAYGMVKYYTGNRTGDVPGNLPQPYYWWEAGAMFGALIDYWYYTGDDEYNAIVTQGMLHQVGANNDFMPKNQTKTEGNDDQAFWGMAAMSAAENNYPDPPQDRPQWLALAQAVFNSQAARWGIDETCGGGLRWQIFTFNQGYNYKNSPSNGGFFNLAARLATYTKNQTYADWAERTWDWTVKIGLMTPEYYVFDGTDVLLNCSELNRIQWSYNAGMYLAGAAHMYKFTNSSEKWKTRVDGLLNATRVFFHKDVPNVMFEVACEPYGKCNVDQRSFKAYLARWMAATTKLAPWTYDPIMTRIRTSAAAAARQCSGGTDGVTCGIKWTQPTWDRSYGVGEQMSALEVIQSNLISKVSGPVTDETGGTSKGDPSAGTGGDVAPVALHTTPISTGDKAGAGLLTALILVGVLGGAWFMVV